MNKGKRQIQQEVLYMPDACAMLGTTRDTIRSMVRRGELPAPFRLGKRVAWRRVDMAQALEKKAREAAKGVR